MMKSSIVLLAFLSFAMIGSSQTVKNVLKIDYSSVSSFTRGDSNVAVSSISKTRYIAPDGTTRTEITDNQHHKEKVTISNETEDYLTTLDPQSRMATRLNGAFRAAHQGAYGTRGSKVSLGPSRIFGYPCQGYANTFPNRAVVKHWVCTDPSTGAKFNGRIEAKRGNSSTEETIANVTSGVTVPLSLFQVPLGYNLATTDAKNGIISFTPMSRNNITKTIPFER